MNSATGVATASITPARANPSKITELKGRPDKEHREENGHQPRPAGHADHCGAEER